MFDNLDDPRQQALLAAAFGLLGGRGKGFGGFAESAGKAGLLGINAYSRASEDKRRNALADMQTKLQGMQFDQMQQDQKWQQALQSGYRPGAPASPAVVSDDFPGAPHPAQPAQPPGFDFSAAMQVNPLKTIQVQQSLNKAEAPLVLSEGQTAFGKDGKPLFNVPKTEKPKFQAGDTREIKSGARVITQEYDGKGWKTLGESPLWKPDAPDKGVAPPQGYQWRPDGGLMPIPGGPADAKVGKEAEKEAAQRDASVSRAKMVLGQIGEAIKGVGPTTAGTGGALLRNIPATGAYNLNKTIDSIKANIGFAELQAMRQASPTGGALGQVAVQELNSLQSVLGSLDTAQSQSQLLSNLYKAEKHYQNWLRAVQKAESESSVDALVKKYGG